MRRNAAELAARLAPHTPTARPSIAARFGKVNDVATRGSPIIRENGAHASANALASRGFASAAAAKPQRRKAKEVATEAPAPLRMKFATGLSKNEDLKVAVVEAISEVKSALGPERTPSWVQLMAWHSAGALTARSYLNTVPVHSRRRLTYGLTRRLDCPLVVH
jgi:hypothetical protein